MNTRRNHSARTRAAERGEPFATWLARRMTTVVYRRSARFAVLWARRDPALIQPFPPLVDALAVQLAQRLPAWAVARLGVDGLLRTAKLIAAFRAPVVALVRTALFYARWMLKRGRIHLPRAAPGRARARVRGTTSTTAAPAARGPHLYLVFNNALLLRATSFADDTVHFHFSRVSADGRAVRVLLRIHGEHAGAPRAAGALFAGESDMVEWDWPAGPPSPARSTRACDLVFPAGGGRSSRSAVASFALDDLPAGDYRIEVAAEDSDARSLMIAAENGRTWIDLGWVRVEGTQAPRLRHAIAEVSRVAP